MFEDPAATISPMLSDRPYMRDDYHPERTSFLIWLLSATIAGFIIQNVFDVWLVRSGFMEMTALSAEAIKQGYLWTLVTYPLLHRDPLHLLVVILAVFFVGRELVQHVGEKRMSWLTLAAVAVGGLAWFAVHFNRGAFTPNVVGATSILLCYLTVFACLFPNREISFLAFFVIPIRTRPKYIAWIVLFVALVGFAFSELPPHTQLRTNVPHSAHLGAMLVGWLYYRWVHESTGWSFRRGSDLALPRWLKRPRKPVAATAGAKPASAGHPSREELRAEVDRILDKINSHGFGALTPEEKRKLDDAKDLLSRR